MILSATKHLGNSSISTSSILTGEHLKGETRVSLKVKLRENEINQKIHIDIECMKLCFFKNREMTTMTYQDDLSTVAVSCGSHYDQF